MQPASRIKTQTPSSAPSHGPHSCTEQAHAGPHLFSKVSDSSPIGQILNVQLQALGLERSAHHSAPGAHLGWVLRGEQHEPWVAPHQLLNLWHHLFEAVVQQPALLTGCSAGSEGSNLTNNTTQPTRAAGNLLLLWFHLTLKTHAACWPICSLCHLPAGLCGRGCPCARGGGGQVGN